MIRNPPLRLLASLTLSVMLTGCGVAFAGPPPGQDPGFWHILDDRKVGAHQLRRKHPTWDGRGVVVAVLDTGVDMRAPGLLKTSEGKVKVIEARDFSGQGAVDMVPAEIKTIDGVRYLATDEGKVRGFEKLPVKPAKGDAWHLGFLTEQRFKNSAVTDLNRNGATNDRFAVLAVTTDKESVVYVDLSGDSDMTGEPARRSYHVAQEAFAFRVPDPEHQRPPLTFALHVPADASTVTFHFDDGGHGTHVAGISTGHQLMGRKGFHGIAPGAQVLSLKIGDNTLSGGSTTVDSMHSAIEFAGEWSKDHKIPVIINISYGIGSEIEGESDIDVALDNALERYPLLAAAVSAGNEGPGMSSVGTPAASQLATAVAAMLPKESAAALYGSRLRRNKIFAFSSRGGEVAKPDVLAPGVASASTAAHDKRDVKGGTSMASPQIAGVYALMASAALARKIRFTGSTMKRALLHSARPLDGYPVTAQGAGVPDVGRAIEALGKLATRREPFRVVGYEVETAVPTSHSRKGAAAYWRTGTYLPSPEVGHQFKIQPLFGATISAKDREAFQTVLSFRSQADWLRVDRPKGKLVGNGPLKLKVSYQRSKLTTPGVYSGRILATPDDAAGIPAFALWNTVIVPHTFSVENKYGLDLRGQSLRPGDIRRIPVLVPPGASHLSIRLSNVRGKWGSTLLQVYEPNGHEWPIDRWRASTDRSAEAVAGITGADLKPGIWEIVVYGSFRNRATTHWDLSVRFRGLDSEPITSWEQSPGESPGGWFSVTNRYDTRFRGKVSGSLFGYRRTRSLEATGDTLTSRFPVNAEIKRIDLVLRLDPKTYNRFTDVAVNVLDRSGKAIEKGGFSNGTSRISIHNESGDAREYTLQIKGGLTKSSDKPWKVSVQETWVWTSPISVSVGRTVVLYPQVPSRFYWSLAATPPKVPTGGFVNYGELRFHDGASNERWLTLPMRLK